MSARLVPRIHRIAPLGAAIMFAFGVQLSASADEPSRINSMSIEELKGIYLGCERTATTSRMDGGDVIYCSLAYEALKAKAFGGEFRRIRSWLDRNCLRVVQIPRTVQACLRRSYCDREESA